MASLESKFSEWFDKEFPSASIKVDQKEIARLLKSKNSHLYTKLLTALSDHFVSKEKALIIKEKSEYIDIRKKRESLRRDMAKLDKDFRNLIPAMKQEEKRLRDEAQTAEVMAAKETYLRILGDALDQVVSICRKYSKIEMPELNLDSILCEKPSVKDLIPSQSFPCTRSRTKNKEMEVRQLIDDIVNLNEKINSTLKDLASMEPTEAPKISLDDDCLKAILDHECVCKDGSEKNESIKGNSRTIDEIGFSALKIVSEYEEQRAAQEEKIFAKLENAASLVSRLAQKK